MLSSNRNLVCPRRATSNIVASAPAVTAGSVTATLLTVAPTAMLSGAVGWAVSN